jgi:hypothetical protein
MTERKKLSNSASKTRKVTPKTNIINNVNDAIKNLGAMFGINQAKRESPVHVIETDVRARRRQLLNPKYNVGEERRRLKEAAEVSSKELK